jgi:hypothetical protein
MRVHKVPILLGEILGDGGVLGSDDLTHQAKLVGLESDARPTASRQACQEPRMVCGGIMRAQNAILLLRPKGIGTIGAPNPTLILTSLGITPFDNEPQPVRSHRVYQYLVNQGIH